MFCTPSERIEIGRRVFAHELTNKEAAAEYGVAEQSIYQYVREYLKSAGIDAVPKAVEAYCTSQEKVDTSGTPFSHTPYLFCTMAGSLGLQYLSLYWTGVR